ncbi:MAG: O-antigen ligase family protein [Candidatus Paceibacterota bacterium]
MKKVAYWVAVIALFIIPFLSLYVSHGYFPFITGKNFAFRALVEIAFGGWVILALADRKYRPRFSWPVLSYKLLVLWMIVADLLAVNPQKAFWSNFERMDGWVTLAHLLVFFVVLASVLTTNNLWRKWWLAFITGAGLVTGYGLLQLMHLMPIHQSADRIDATLGNAEYLAGYLLFAIAITLWQAFETRDREYAWLKYTLFVLTFLEFVVLFATGTRATIFALIGAGIVGSVLWMLESGKQGRKGALAVLIALVLVVGGLFALRNTSFIQSSPNLNRLASTFSLKSALGTRITIWHMAIEGVQAKPLHGWGQEGYNYVFNTYYEPSLYGQEPWFDRAHDVFLDWLVAGGIPALLLFLSVLGTAMYSLYRAPISRPARIMLLSALVAYVIQGLAVFDNIFTYIPFIAIIAYVHSISSRPIRMLETLPQANETALNTIVAPVVLVATLLVVWFVNVPSVRAGYDLIGALTPANDVTGRYNYFKQAYADGSFADQEITEQLVQFAPQVVGSSQVPEALRSEIAQYSVNQMGALVTAAPRDTRLHLQYALLLRGIGSLNDAQTESSKARELSPNKQTVIIEQGIESFQLGNFVAAKEYFSQAAKLFPGNKDAETYVAGTLILEGNVPAAKAQLMQTYGTTSVNHPILLLAYYQTKDWNDLIVVVKQRLLEMKDANTSYQLAAVYAQMGRMQDAIAQVRETMLTHPETAAQGQSLLDQLGVK